MVCPLKNIRSVLCLLILIITALGTNMFLIDNAEAGAGDFTGSDSSDTVATTGDEFNFSVNASGYDKVEVAYYFGSDNSTWVNMSHSSGTYTHNITIPSNSTDTLHYWFIGTYTLNETEYWDSMSLEDVTVTDNDPPTIGSDNTPSTAYTSADLQFDVSNVTDNYGNISSISLEITAYTLSEYEIWNETKTSFSYLNGHYILNYSIHYAIALYVYPRMEFWYRFIITDESDNSLITPKKKIVVLDDIPPTLQGDHTPETGFTTGDIWLFQVSASDSFVISSCTLKVNESGVIGTQSNSESSNYIDSYFYYESGRDDLTHISYWFVIEDEYNNVLVTDPSNRTIVDNDKPMLDVDHTSITAYTGNILSFSVNLTDNIGIDQVHINYTSDNTTWYNVSMQNDSSPNWYHNSTVEDRLDPIWYTIYFNDTSDNRDNTTTKMIQVFDDDLPEFIADHTATSATTGDPLEFKVEITDNIEVDSVWLDYGYEEWPEENLSMTRSEENNWTVTIDVFENPPGPLYYTFCFNDTSNNWNRTPEVDMEVYDNDLPFLGVDNTPAIAIMGQQITFQVNIEDNIDTQDVYVEYRYGDGTVTNLSLSRSSYFEVTIDILNILEDIHYSFHFSDTSGNWNQTAENTVVVFDYTLPFISEDLSDRSAKTGDGFEFQVFVYDNIEVFGVSAHYWFGSGGIIELDLELNQTEGKWKNFMEIPHSLDQLHYMIYVNDTSGNVANTSAITLNVSDNDLPNLREDLTGDTCYTGDPFQLLFNISDNIDIVDAYVEYWFGSEHINVTLEETTLFSAEIYIPHDMTGYLHYILHLLDTENHIVIEAVTIPVIDNDLPEVMGNFTDVSAFTGEELRFSVVVSDNIEISNVAVMIVDGPILMTTFNLSFIEGSYNGTIYVPTDAFGVISYIFQIIDSSENILITNVSNITIHDIIPPSIEPIEDMTVYANQPFHFDVNASDNIQLSDMMVLDHEFPRNESRFTATLTAPGIHNLTIMALDAAGNNKTLTFTVEVLPEDHDADGDGMPDLYEIDIGLNPNDHQDRDGDDDQDNLTNLQEYRNGTDPFDDDTDDDGMKDNDEIFYGLNPLNPIDASQDMDSDGTSNLDELLRGTDPTVIDNNEDPIEDPVDDKRNDDPLIPIIAGIALAILLIIIVIVIIAKSRGKTTLVGRKKKMVTTKKNAKIFISYSSKDEDTALSVCVNLERRGIKCWIAPRDILSGESYGGSIVNAINNSLVMILIYSGNSNISPQVIREIERAVSKKIKIIPVRIDDSDLSNDMEYFISSSHWLDATSPPIEKHIDKIENAVKGMLAEQGNDREE